jgi:hypothetical protein
VHLGSSAGISLVCRRSWVVAVDMDIAGLEPVQHKLAYLSDAEARDGIYPSTITWIAWAVRRLDGLSGGVRDAMSRGNTGRRKLIEIPTGHMLKSSRQALGVFQLYRRREVADMTGGRPVTSAAPSVADLGADAHRRDKSTYAARGGPPGVLGETTFSGRDRRVGFELMMLTSAYRDFMLRPD